MNPKIIDLILVISANLFNLILSVIMLSRVKKFGKLEYRLGLISTSLIVPILIGISLNFRSDREWWMMVLPGLLGAFLILEFVLDYVIKSNFRETRWLGPYLLLFYLAQWGMIGYGFGVIPAYGFTTLITYFISLGATAYSYAKVRHGDSKL